MKVVIAGDVVNSRKNAPSTYLPIIEESLSIYTLNNMSQIYRGDSFQAQLKKPENALKCALEMKSGLKMTKGLDVRISIGFGTVNIFDHDISKSNGSALVRAGETLDKLKDVGQNIMVNSSDKLDYYMNTALKMACVFMDDWNEKSAEVMYEMTRYLSFTQEDLGKRLGIKQASVSRRLSRANWVETKELLDLFNQYCTDLKINNKDIDHDANNTR